LSSKRNVTASEDKELKKIRRLIKNREYAQSSRDKRKQYVDGVEQKLNDIANENKNLKEENNILKYQFSLINQAISQDVEIEMRLKKNSSKLGFECRSKYWFIGFNTNNF